MVARRGEFRGPRPLAVWYAELRISYSTAMMLLPSLLARALLRRPGAGGPA